MTITLGAMAEITVKDPRQLSVPVIHRVPNEALKHRLRLYLAFEEKAWSVTRRNPRPARP